MDPRIDRLRGLLAIGVLIGHVIDLALTRDSSGLLPQLCAAGRPYFGFICVVGFIVLSGYCITRSTLTRFSPGDYTLRRITRLYPLLLIVVLPTAIMEVVMVDSPHRPRIWYSNIDMPSFVYAALGLSGFRATFGSLAPAYTISYELLYYAIWGLSLTVAVGRRYLGWLLATALAAVLLVFGDSLRTGMGTWAGFAPPLGLTLLPAWLLGSGLALWQRQLTAAMRWVPVWACWIALAVGYAYGFDVYQKPRLAPLDWGDVAYYSAISGLLVLTMAAWLSTPARANPTDTRLGELSYPLFLAHGPVIITAVYLMNLFGVKVNFEATMLILMAASVAVALVLTTYVERPLMAWRSRGRARAPVASTLRLADTESAR